MRKTESMRVSIICFLMIGYFSLGLAQSKDYGKIFGSDWENAVKWVDENRSWIEPKLEKYNISYSLAIAVIFPELVRYAAMRDRMETTLCKALYINHGEKYADFSIGVFQMKPSFAEHIRKEASVVMLHRSHVLFKDREEYDGIKAFRASIIADLQKPETQLNYLIAFFKISESRFRMNRMNDAEKLKFLATAYNYGFYKDHDEIEKMIDRKFFNTKLFQQENYAYSDVSLYWFKNQ